MSDPLDKYFTAPAESTPAASADPLDKYFTAPLPEKPKSKQSLVGGFVDAFSEGATYGLDADVEAMVGSGSHEQNRQNVRDRRESFMERDTPSWLAAQGGYIAGSVASALAPVPTPTKAGIAGKALNYILPNVNAAKITAQAPTRTLMHESGKAGAKTAGLHGLSSGNVDPDADTLTYLSERFGNAATQAPIGYGVGAATGPIIVPAVEAAGRAVGNGLDFARRAVTEGASPVSGGERAVVQGAIDDGLMDRGGFGAIRDRLVPSYGRGANAMDQSTAETILYRHSELVASGLDDAAARAQVAQEHASMGVNPRTARTQVNRIVDSYTEQNAVPANLSELVALETGSEGKNTFGNYRYGVNSGSPEANNAATWARERQAGVGENVEGVLGRRLGNGDVAAAIEEQAQRAGAANDLYPQIMDRFNQSPEAQQALQSALNNARTEWAVRMGNRADDMAVATNAQVEKFLNPYQQQIAGPVNPTTGLPTVQTVNTREGTNYLDGFIHQRRSLTDAIEASKNKFGGDTSLTHDLRDLKGVIDRNVRGITQQQNVSQDARDIFQDWVGANALRSDAAFLQRAWEDGGKFALKPGSFITASKSARGMARYENMPPDQQEMFREGLMASLATKLQAGGDGHDVAKIFTNRATRNALERIIGPQQTAAIYEQVQRAGLATRTFKADKNSITGSLLESEKRLGTLQRMAASIRSWSPQHIIGSGMEHIAQQMQKDRNSQMMRLYGTNTASFHSLVDALRALEAAQASVQTSRLGQQIPQATAPFVATVPGVTAGGMTRMY